MTTVYDISLSRLFGTMFGLFFVALSSMFGHTLVGVFIGLAVYAAFTNPERQIARVFDAVAQNPVRWALVTAVVGVLIGGVAFSLMESDKNVVDGWWWAFISMTTVGYGDLSPKTPEVRMIAAMVIMDGVLSTAILTSALAGRVADNRQAKRMEAMHHTAELDDDIEHIQTVITDALQTLSDKVSHPKVVAALRQVQDEQTTNRRTR